MAADDTDTQTQTAPATPVSPDMLAQALQLSQQLMPQPIQPDTTPAQGGIVGLLGRIGSALAGGSVTDVMSPAQRERAGIRALGDFGTSLMAGSGYYPGKPMFGGLAQGFQGAERSEAGSEQQVAAMLGAQQDYQTKQAALRLKALQDALPFLRMGAASGIPNVLVSGPAVPGTAQGAGTPGGGVAGPLTAYGKGGPAATVPVPPEYMPLFEAAAKRTGVPVDLLIAQARQESGFNPGATGGAGEVGIMQIHPKTAADPGFGLTGVQNPAVLRDPATNINFGADYLAARAKSAGADLSTPEGQAKALQAYNGGGDPNYVQNVTRYMPAPLAPVQTAGPGAPTGGPTTPPAATPPAPAQTSPAGSTAQPPTASTETSAATPPAPPAFADFQAKNPIPTTPEEQATLDGLKRVQQQTAIELQNAPLTGVDRVKAVQAAREAADNLATATRGIQDAHTAHQVTLYNAQLTRQQGDEKAAADRAAAVALKTQEGEQAIKLANIQGDQQRVTNKEQVINTANLEGLKTAQKEQGESRDVVAQLQGFSAISDGVGQPGWLQTTKLPGSDKTIAETLGQLGMPLSDTGGVQLLRGGINNLVKTLRQGMAMGSLSDRDLNFIERMGPTEWMDQDTRTAAVGYLKQAYQAKQRFTSDVQKEMARGKNYGDAMDTADAKQKPFVPAVPADLTAHWSDNSPEWAQRRIEWAQQNEVRPGTLYHMADGKIMVMKSPRAQQQGQQ